MCQGPQTTFRFGNSEGRLLALSIQLTHGYDILYNHQDTKQKQQRKRCRGKYQGRLVASSQRSPPSGVPQDECDSSSNEV